MRKGGVRMPLRNEEIGEKNEELAARRAKERAEGNERACRDV
jgi:hypothetical protein